MSVAPQLFTLQGPFNLYKGVNTSLANSAIKEATNITPVKLGTTLTFTKSDTEVKASNGPSYTQITVTAVNPVDDSIKGVLFIDADTNTKAVAVVAAPLPVVPATPAKKTSTVFCGTRSNGKNVRKINVTTGGRRKSRGKHSKKHGKRRKTHKKHRKTCGKRSKTHKKRHHKKH